MSTNNKAKAYKAYKGDNGKWGVEAGGVLYDPGFSKATAVRIAQLNNRKSPPKDWEETEEILLKEGFDVKFDF